MDKISPAVAAQIKEATLILKRGGVVVYPTDTVYGVGASMASSAAVERVFEVKQRPRQMAFPILVGNIRQIETLADGVSPLASCLIDAFFPGALTLVLRASRSAPGYLVTQEGTIALRIPDHPVPLALIEAIGAGLVGTSANLSGKPSAVTAEEARSQLGKRVDLIIDGGRCPGTESTVVDVTGESPVVLRQGALSKTKIDEACRKLAGHGG
jgi:L-threonylcarbamoyladenylate synthase